MDNLNYPPTEQEVREHFNLSADAPLMRVPQTTIWALTDGTLLWDWRNGYAELRSSELIEHKPAKLVEKHSVLS